MNFNFEDKDEYGKNPFKEGNFLFSTETISHTDTLENKLVMKFIDLK